MCSRWLTSHCSLHVACVQDISLNASLTYTRSNGFCLCQTTPPCLAFQAVVILHYFDVYKVFVCIYTQSLISTLDGCHRSQFPHRSHSLSTIPQSTLFRIVWIILMLDSFYNPKVAHYKPAAVSKFICLVTVYYAVTVPNSHHSFLKSYSKFVTFCLDMLLPIKLSITVKPRYFVEIASDEWFKTVSALFPCWWNWHE